MADLSPDAVLAQFQPIFQEVLDEPDLEVTLASSASDTPNWDSLSHLEIIEMIQRRFKVKFTLAEMQKLSTVGDLVDLVIAKSITK